MYADVSTTYFPIKGEHEATHMKVDVYYSLGCVNAFTYANEPRGYYVSVGPVEKKGRMESFVAFSGLKKCVLEVNRKSVKAAENALRLAQEWVPTLLEMVCQKAGIPIEDVATEKEVI